MNRRKLIRIIGLVIVFIAALFWQQNIIHHLGKDNRRYQEKLGELEVLREENGRLKTRQVDPAELDRLRKTQSDYFRLKGEANQLRRQLKEVQSGSTKPGATVQTSTNALPQEPVTTHTSEIKARLGADQTLVTGGWATRPGRRAFVLASPSTIDAAGNKTEINTPNAQLLIRTRFAELPEENLAQFGLGFEKWNSTGKESLVLNDAQMAVFIKALESMQGVDILSAPAVTTLAGRQAQIQVTDIKTIAGQNYELGPIVDFIPQISADGTSIELTGSARLRLETNPP